MLDEPRILDIGGVKAGPDDDVGVLEEICGWWPVIATAREYRPEPRISVDIWLPGPLPVVMREVVDALTTPAELLDGLGAGVRRQS
ncbi:MAG: hypothetical protein ACRD0H_16305 [Actinomycetes bacterium]